MPWVIVDLCGIEEVRDLITIAFAVPAMSAHLILMAFRKF